MSKERTSILIVDDEDIVRESLSDWLRKDGYAIDTAPDGPSAIEKLGHVPFSVMLVDLKMPGMDGLRVLESAKAISPDTSVVVMTAYATVGTAVEAMRLGAYDYLVKPFDPEELSLLLVKIVAGRQLVRDNVLLRKALKREYRFRDMVSKNTAMHKVFEVARSAARCQSVVLISGERGTGKELLARAIHAESPRRDAPFMAISCSALTETMLESELFGHERGAFTGAIARKRGKLEVADGGTVFLDEVGAIGPKLQADFLRVLEDRRFFRAGGTEPVDIDIRVIAATTRDLKQTADNQEFRPDLFYQLNVVPLVLPPLRDRREDIPLLVDHFLERLSAEMDRPVDGVSPGTLALLMEHDWPGNIRELRNLLERGMVVSQGAQLQPDDLGLTPATAPLAEGDSDLTLDEVERRHIAVVLHHAGGNITRAARTLDIDRVTLYNKIKKYDLKRR
jgi:DNA-binding NtrC family response regulator